MADNPTPPGAEKEPDIVIPPESEKKLTPEIPPPNPETANPDPDESNESTDTIVTEEESKIEPQPPVAEEKTNPDSGKKEGLTGADKSPSFWDSLKSRIAGNKEQIIKNEEQKIEKVPEKGFKLIGQWVIIALITAFLIAAVFLIYNGLNSFLLTEIVKDHFVATIVLPIVAIASLLLILILKVTSGPIEFEVMGFKFKDASGFVILWIVCFLVITATFKWLW